MSDELENTGAEPQPEAASNPTPEIDTGLSDFINQTESENSVPDPSKVITIRTSGGETRYVPVPDGVVMTAGEAFINSGLTIQGNGFQTYLNGALIKVTDVVPAGSTLTVVGSVKGGVA